MNTIALEYYNNRFGSLNSHNDLWSNYHSFRFGPNLPETPSEADIKKQEKSFYEFIIDGKPLSRIIDFHFKNKTPVTFNWVGILGFTAKQYDLVLVKRLLNKPLYKNELLPFFKNDIEELDRYLLEIEQDKRILLYGCPCCEMICGGYFLNIIEKDNTIIWVFNKDSKTFYNYAKEVRTETKNIPTLSLEFDKQKYYTLFNDYLNN